MKKAQKINVANERMRIIKEDLNMIESKRKRLQEERAELILKLVATRETIIASREQDE